MNRNSNAYTFIFAILIVIIIAGSLTFTSIGLKPLQCKNIKSEKMQKILGAIGINVPRDDAQSAFEKHIKAQLSLTGDGFIDKKTVAFDINLQNEIKKNSENQRYPLYMAEKDGTIFYVIPLYGAGLWDAIWGYIALASDKNTIVGANFDHKSETPGLGAEITTDWFQRQFEGKKLLNSDNSFVSVMTVKGGAKIDDPHGVDAISGGTITSNGVSIMVKERLKNYLSFFKKDQIQ